MTHFIIYNAFGVPWNRMYVGDKLNVRLLDIHLTAKRNKLASEISGTAITTLASQNKLL